MPLWTLESPSSSKRIFRGALTWASTVTYRSHLHILLWTRRSLGPFANFIGILLCGAVAAHPGPSVWGDFLLAEDRVVLTVEGAAGPLRTNLSIPHLMIGPLTEAAERECREHLQRVFREGFPVEIDGVRRTPTVTGMVIQDGDPEDLSWRMAGVTLEYPCDGLPRRVSIRWDEFEGEGIEFIPMTIKRVGETPSAFGLWEDHPTWTWHAEHVPVDRRPVAAVDPASAAVWRVPVASAVAALVGLGLLLGLARGRRLGPALGGALMVGDRKSVV